MATATISPTPLSTLPQPSTDVPWVLQDQRRMTYAQIRREIRAAKATQKAASDPTGQNVRPRRRKNPETPPKTKQARTIKRLITEHPFAGQALKRAKTALKDLEYSKFIEFSIIDIPNATDCDHHGVLQVLHKEEGPNTFVGQVVIQRQQKHIIPAIEQALSEHDLDGTPELQDPDRQVFYVDAASWHTETMTGLAVVQQGHRHASEPHWLAKGYRIEQSLKTEDAEAWAISQASQCALQKKHVECDFTKSENPASIVVIYSDCIATLQKIKKETGWSGAGGVKQKILDQSMQLQGFGTKVELHWVPGHKDIPGNVLADLVAKRARQLPQEKFERLPF
ncbi:MAG: hypothetical protein LQ350_000040 [Teloschistes chrysophthalmus]|nr:MAG: hypothetical protein LQ350_000040 [Niorma chrysophthalma]